MDQTLKRTSLQKIFEQLYSGRVNVVLKRFSWEDRIATRVSHTRQLFDRIFLVWDLCQRRSLKRTVDQFFEIWLRCFRLCWFGLFLVIHRGNGLRSSQSNQCCSEFHSDTNSLGSKGRLVWLARVVIRSSSPIHIYKLWKRWVYSLPSTTRIGILLLLRTLSFSPMKD